MERNIEPSLPYYFNRDDILNSGVVSLEKIRWKLTMEYLPDLMFAVLMNC